MPAKRARKKPRIVPHADLSVSLLVITTAVNNLEATVTAMQARTARGVARAREESERLLAALTRVHQARKSRAHAAFRRLDDKILA